MPLQKIKNFLIIILKILILQKTKLSKSNMFKMIYIKPLISSKFKSFLILFNLFMCFLLFSNSVLSQDITKKETVHIPEPLMFDLVRGLGAKQGEFEVNSLGDFPINNTANRNVEWAPEIEYALFDNFAIELEFPMNNLDLEAFKVAAQWTIGSSKNNRFIHGVQVIGESYIHDDIQEFNFLYIPAYRFNEVWSAIGLFGVMLETGSDASTKNYTILLNASIFANINKHTVLGVELNNTDPTIQKKDDNSMELLILPQIHYAFDNGFSLQFGLGSKYIHEELNGSAVLRVIKSF